MTTIIKNKATEKLNSMTIQVAYPDEVLDVSKLEKFYGALSIDPDNYLESLLILNRFKKNYSLGKLGELHNKTEWNFLEKLTMANGYNSVHENKIRKYLPQGHPNVPVINVFPAGILQGIYFSNDRPKYMNYGVIGHIIGHEITHGFDIHGRLLDKDGNLVDWWTNGTKEKFIKRFQCFEELYRNLRTKEIGLEDESLNTLDDDMADLGGIKISYRAYIEWTKKNGEEPVLPGMPGFQVARKKAKLQVIGPNSNLPEFGEDFKCPLGSKMNPVHKCTVW